MALRQFSKTLEIILYRTLQRLMGRNSVTLLGIFTFGIRVIYVWLIDYNIWPEFKHDKTPFVTS